MSDLGPAGSALASDCLPERADLSGVDPYKRRHYCVWVLGGEVRGSVTGILADAELGGQRESGRSLEMGGGSMSMGMVMALAVSLR